MTERCFYQHIHRYIWFHQSKVGLGVDLEDMVQAADVNHLISLTPRRTGAVRGPMINAERFLSCVERSDLSSNDFHRIIVAFL